MGLKKEICYIGIDVGKQGGIVAIYEGKVVLTEVMPVQDKYYLSGDIRKIFENLKKEHENLLITIEDVHSLFTVSAKSNFQFGFGAGLIEGVCIGMGLPFMKVHPKKWQEYAWQGIQPVQHNTGKFTKQGGPKYKTDPKATSLIAAHRLFPSVDLTKSVRAKKAHEGIVDALLISYYASKTR